MARVADTFEVIRGRAGQLRAWVGENSVLLRPVTGRVRTAWATVSPLGRTVALVGLVCWIAGWRLGWRELMVVAGGCLVLLVVTGLFMLGHAAVSIDIRLEPPRVVAGDSSAGEVTVANQSGRRILPFRVELPVGAGLAAFEIGSLGPGDRAEELFFVPTERRGVIPVGPATSMRGDPLGLFHREAASSPARELIVHPRTIALSPFGAGLLRDLEGLTTRDLSMSDLAFHALRDYEPGDDRRYVHWRSSARAGRLLVRQFLDTRRATLCVVVDAQPGGYGDPEQFEVALEVAGSVAMRACRDGLAGVVVAGEQAATGAVPHVLLDALSRAEMRKSSPDLPTLVSRASTRGDDISVAVLVSGPTRTVAELQRAASRFSPAVQVLALRIAPGDSPGIEARGRATVARLSELADLPALLRMEVVV